VIGLAAVGSLMGAGVFAVIWHLAGPRPSALTTLGRYDAYRAATTGASGAPAPVSSRWQERLGSRLSRELQRRGIAYTSLRQDLALTGRSYESVMGRKAVAFAGGFVLALLSAAGLQLTAGSWLPAGSPVVLALLTGAGFFILPDVEARREASQHRREFRRALGGYLDLVALEMAGSAAPAEALPTAARVGAGWPLALIRDTLYRATTAGRDQWTALSELGERVGVDELRDLGALIRLVGQDGAQVRETLTARAASMRRQELAAAEGEAGERDQSMQMAQLLPGFAFILLLVYPAVMAVMVI